MRAKIEVHGSTGAAKGYVGWALSPARVSLTEANGASDSIEVELRNRDSNNGGQLVFTTDPTVEPESELTLELPPNGDPADFFVAGEFKKPSVEDGDAVIEIAVADDGSVLGSRALMVRVRKDAESLTDAERDRFLHAFALLNSQGLGDFRQFRDMHRDQTSHEAHGFAGFLPWHRAYLLDLERELQGIDPSVALPYWRFDRAAPRLFTIDFIGESDPSDEVRFAPTNPLRTWSTEGQGGVLRRVLFDPTTSGASQFGNPVRGEEETIALGDLPNPASPASFQQFSIMEGNPHGRTHRSFRGFISTLHTAARDPLFFLLHCNVDRLWAKWQWLRRRFDVSDTDVFPFPGSAGDPGATRIGHNLGDTMWPWNQVTGSPRPSNAPGGSFPGSPLTDAPGQEPEVSDMIAFQGNLNLDTRLGFDYDDVPYEA